MAVAAAVAAAVAVAAMDDVAAAADLWDGEESGREEAEEGEGWECSEAIELQTSHT
jgi:hypothetical protein